MTCPCILCSDHESPGGTSDIKDQLGLPASTVTNQRHRVTRDGLDLVVQHMPREIDRLTQNLSLQAQTIRRDLDGKSAIKRVAGFAAEDQLVEPVNQQAVRRIGRKRDVLGLLGLDLIAVGDDDIEQGFRGGLEQVGQIGGENSQAEVGRVIEGLRSSHERASRFFGRNSDLGFPPMTAGARTIPRFLAPAMGWPSRRMVAVALREASSLAIKPHGAQPFRRSVMVEVGKPAPDFTLQDQLGKKVTLSKLKGSPIVLYFYPKDDTPGCTKEACAFRDAFAEYEKLGAKILGVSPDGVESHAKFIKKHELPFTLLADMERKVCEAYGVWKEKNMYGKKSMGVERTSFVIDSKGIVRQVFPKVKVDGHSDAVLTAIKAAT